MPDHAPLTEAPVPLPDVLQFMRLLWALEHALQSASKRMSSRLGVSGLQRLVLRIVGLAPGVSAGDIARTLHVHPSTLTGVFTRLIDQRLLERSEHAADRRRAVLVLTPRGRRVNAATAGTVEAAVRTALRGVSGRDRSIVRRVMVTLCNALEREGAVNGRTPGRPGRRDGTVRARPAPRRSSPTRTRVPRDV